MTWRAGGIRPWILQRLSAVFMVVVLVLFFFKLIVNGPSNYSAWHQWMSDSFWNTLVIMFWLSLIGHAWIGIRDVVMDYIHPDGIRFAVLSVFGFYLAAMTIWMLKIMFGVSA